MHPLFSTARRDATAILQRPDPRFEPRLSYVQFHIMPEPGIPAALLSPSVARDRRRNPLACGRAAWDNDAFGDRKSPRGQPHVPVPGEGSRRDRIRDIQDVIRRTRAYVDDVLTCLYLIRGWLASLEKRVAILLDQIQMDQSRDTILPR